MVSLYEEEISRLEKMKSINFSLKDSKVEVITKDPNQYGDLNKIINRILQPRNKQIYETLVDKNSEDKDKQEINIKFEYAFGF